jgi:hypothetical protein
MSKLKFVLPLIAIFVVGCPDDEQNDVGEDQGYRDPGQDPNASLEELCPINCDLVEQCYGLEPGETLADCIAQCIEWRTEDLDRMGDTCDGLLIELLECQYRLSCDDYDHYHQIGQEIGDPCGPEFEAYHFTENCMGGAE